MEYEKINNRENLPNLIVGMEYKLETWHEVLIFGKEAIEQILKYDEVNSKTLKAILKDHPSCAIICHPFYEDVFDDNDLFEAASGIEITSRGNLLESRKEIILGKAEEYHLKIIASSDFHAPGNSSDSYTLIEADKICNETDLIQAFQNNLKFEIVLA